MGTSLGWGCVVGRTSNFIGKRFTADIYFVLFTFLLLLVVLWRAVQSLVLTLLLSGEHKVNLANIVSNSSSFLC